MRNFEDITVSTKTFTAATNVLIDLEKLFDHLDVTMYYPFIGLKKIQDVDYMYPDMNIQNGDIITLKFRRLLKGIDLKKRKNQHNIPFRNSFTSVMFVLDKFINFKVYKNGTFQMTGCKNKKHAIVCVYNMWKRIRNTTSIYTFKGTTCTFETFFIPAMRNIDFNQNYIVDQEKLALYMNTQPNFYCLLDTNFGYTGTNIKREIDKSITKLGIVKMCEVDNVYSFSKVPYSEFLITLPSKARDKRMETKYNTFLVFHSGKIIMSGINSKYMRNAYYSFVELMTNNRDKIEEKLNTQKLDFSQFSNQIRT